jgi:hypothetical protein
VCVCVCDERNMRVSGVCGDLDCTYPKTTHTIHTQYTHTTRHSSLHDRWADMSDSDGEWDPRSVNNGMQSSDEEVRVVEWSLHCVCVCVCV